jgi:alcohol dehydrogenase class IV
MPYFLSPKVIYGKGALKRLSVEMGGKGDRAAIITDHTLKEKCADLVESVRAAGYEVTIWDQVEADPTLGITLVASRFLLESNPQWVIGFGGGSAIDTAKAALVLYERPDLATGDRNLGPNCRKGSQHVHHAL